MALVIWVRVNVVLLWLCQLKGRLKERFWFGFVLWKIMVMVLVFGSVEVVGNGFLWWLVVGGWCGDGMLTAFLRIVVPHVVRVSLADPLGAVVDWPSSWFMHLMAAVVAFGFVNSIFFEILFSWRMYLWLFRL